MRKVKVGSKYKHYKGNYYEVIGIARFSEDPNKEFVIYKALYDSLEFGPNQLWARPKEEFLEKITRNGKTFNRFEEVIK